MKRYAALREGGRGGGGGLVWKGVKDANSQYICNIHHSSASSYIVAIGAISACQQVSWVTVHWTWLSIAACQQTSPVVSTSYMPTWHIVHVAIEHGNCCNIELVASDVAAGT